ncbi:hypothetical protein KVMX100_130092 [Klebsiella variicola]|nr:hypothetical protein KVMX100_130092 [Klebsiella variicola]
MTKIGGLYFSFLLHLTFLPGGTTREVTMLYADCSGNWLV